MKKYILIFKDNVNKQITIQEFDDFKLAHKKYLLWKNILSKCSTIRVYITSKIE